MSEERAERCDLCRFWTQYEPTDGAVVFLGQCRRRAPLPLVWSSDQEETPIVINTWWPDTLEHQWCGEFQSRKDEP